MTTAGISSSGGSMPVLFFDVRGSWRDFPRGEFWSLVPNWWFVDVESGGALWSLGLDGEPGVLLGDVLALEDGMHRGMRRLVHERWPNRGEVCVRANDGGLVAWVDGLTLTKLFGRVGELQLSCVERTELSTRRVTGFIGAGKSTFGDAISTELSTRRVTGFMAEAQAAFEGSALAVGVPAELLLNDRAPAVEDHGRDDLVSMLLEAIDCLGRPEEGTERERELSDQFDELIGNDAAGDRAERLRALLVALRDVPSKQDDKPTSSGRSSTSP